MTTIGICAQTLSRGAKAMFEALGSALSVSFEVREFNDDRNVDGWIVLSAGRKVVSQIDRATRPCYVVLDESELIPCGTSSTLTFAGVSEVADVLRGRTITADDAVSAKALPHGLVDAIPLAFKDGSAVWATQTRGVCRHHYVALPPPEMNDDEPLFTHFSGRRIARLLPLVLFVRSLCERGWEHPPLRATFMFDDPNLHWTSYGFIDYDEMVRHAAAGRYHVSVATIPLDAWFVHEPAGAIFRNNTGRLSLLVHGNDHLHRELARSQSPDTMQRLLSQAAGRIAAMERRTGLEVARVMAPPHGACSEMALSQMAGAGFEAVCVSRGSLRHHNPAAQWTRTIGMKPCDIVAGIPVIPRFGLTESCRNDILVAALLRQPIVAVTHHHAVADGYELLDHTASFVNSLGAVQWGDMKDISRSLYSQRQADRILSVRMWSKRLTVPVPAGITHVHVERPWLDGSDAEALHWRTLEGDRSWKVAQHGDSIAVPHSVTIEIGSGPTDARRHCAQGVGPRGLAAVARRLLTEARDRALPSIHRIAQR